MTKLNIDEFVSSSISANQEIYNLIQTNHDNFKKPLSKGYGGDISLMMDIEAEKIFVKYLSKYGKIFSEESGEIGQGEFTIVIDPIDGSDNYKSNFPYFGSSVAIKKDDKVLAGVVTNFANGDIFIKTDRFFKRGKFFKSEFLDVKKNSFDSVGIFERGYKSEVYSKKLREIQVKYRIAGAFALSLAYAHEVSFVLFYGKIRSFDICAGKYMCEDLFLYEDDDIFLVSKDEEMFNKIRKLI